MRAGGVRIMNYRERYEQWLNDEFFDEATRRELKSLTDEKEIEDRFYRDLEFGTGGLRGVMGAGTNRMNKYTVGKATAGLGKYLLDTYGAEACKNRGVVIGYDTRNNSEFFSRTAANVLSGMGIRVYLHAHARPTPQLSFSVKFWNALAGVVVTASHNPKEYNGYKVYDEFGCQLVPWQAKQVISYRITVIHKKNGGLSDARNAGLSKASGEYILYVDSDDYLEDDTIEWMVSCAVTHNAEIVACTCKRTNNKNVPDLLTNKIVEGTGIEMLEFAFEREIRCRASDTRSPHV